MCQNSKYCTVTKYFYFVKLQHWSLPTVMRSLHCMKYLSGFLAKWEEIRCEQGPGLACGPWVWHAILIGCLCTSLTFSFASNVASLNAKESKRTSDFMSFESYEDKNHCYLEWFIQVWMGWESDSLPAVLNYLIHKKSASRCVNYML